MSVCDVQEVRGALHIHPLEVIFCRAPFLEGGGEMAYRVDSLELGMTGAGIQDIAIHDGHAEGLERFAALRAGIGTTQRYHLVTRRTRMLYEVASNETARACNK